MKDKELAVWGCLGILVSIPLTVALNGWALSVLWNWFIVTALHAPGLTIAQAVGIALVTGTMKNANFTQEDPKYKEYYTKVIIWTAGPLIAVGMGWIVKHWI